MAQTAALSETDVQQLDTLQRLALFIINERALLKAKLERREICQATFDELDPVAEEALFEVENIIEQIKSQQ
jgi:tellurite resistance protein